MLGPVEVAVLPAAPFVVGPHQRVFEHATNAICLDCNRHVGIHTGRKNINYHALKGTPCQPLRGKNVRSLIHVSQEQVCIVHQWGGAPPGWIG
eukprot:1686245-Amphidinium_carterae.1